jgi:hypothetical protein
MWSQDTRHGVGTLYCPSGSIFVGTYMQDKRQGLGVTYWAGRCKKYVAEYVDDMATTGCVMELDDEAVEVPATEQLREAIAAARVRAAGAAARTAAVGDQTAAQLPELKLIQPSKVRWTEQIIQSINVTSEAMKFIENSCQPFTENHLFSKWPCWCHNHQWCLDRLVQWLLL